MFAMFRLGRPNILPVGDLGVRRGMQNLYKLKVWGATISLSMRRVQPLHDLICTPRCCYAVIQLDFAHRAQYSHRKGPSRLGCRTAVANLQQHNAEAVCLL